MEAARKHRCRFIFDTRTSYWIREVARTKTLMRGLRTGNQRSRRAPTAGTPIQDWTGTPHPGDKRSARGMVFAAEKQLNHAAHAATRCLSPGVSRGSALISAA